MILKEGVQKVRKWFMQTSFWKKLVITFTINIVVLLVVTDAIMVVLFRSISTEVISRTNAEAATFNTATNNYVAISTANMIIGVFNLYANLLLQVLSCYNYFSTQSNLYTSHQTQNPPFPALTSQFQSPNYTEPGIYLFSNISTFLQMPYLDYLLSNILSNAEMSQVKRINVYVQNNTNSSDLTVRTLPGSNDFIIPSLAIVANRFNALQPGMFIISNQYSDQYSKSNNSTLLMGLRSTMPAVGNQGFQIYFEVEIYSSIIDGWMDNTYYFPSAQVLFVDTANKTVITTNAPQFVANVTQFQAVGFHEVLIGSVSYLVVSIGISSTYVLGEVMAVTNATDDTFRCIVMVSVDEAQSPSINIDLFMQLQTTTLDAIIFGWSFVILLSNIGLATVVGNYVFSNLRTLSTKLKLYIKEPSKFHQISIELKELQVKGIMKKLIDNLISIIEKIEARKREKLDRTSQNIYPLNIAETQFQLRAGLNDAEIFDDIRRLIARKQAEFNNTF